MRQTPDPAKVREADRHRLEIFEAVSAAISHRSEVIQACYGARDSDEAIAAIGQLLGVSEQGARAVLDLQFRRLTEFDRASIDAQVRDMREQLEG